MRRATVCGAALALTAVLGACAITDRYAAAQIVGGSESEVSVIVGTRRDPGPAAFAHCATFGRTAVLDGYEMADSTGLGATKFIYHFRCASP